MSVVDGSQTELLEREALGAENCAALEDIERRLQAITNLPPYEVNVVKRETIGEPEYTPQAQYHSELVHFSDGAVRELTRATPNERWFGPNTSALPISGTDALFSGPRGINKKIISGLAELGYPVEWLHHQGRHAELPTSIKAIRRIGHFLFGKSVGRSAHHQHALFNDFSARGSISYDDTNLLSAGDSRGAMTGEAVDALGPQNKRSIIYSDYIAACFEHRPEPKDIPLLMRMLPREGLTLGKLAVEKIIDAMRSGDVCEVTEYLGTIDLHPMNMIHELAWIWPLLCGDAGKYAKAVPLDAVGVRTLERRDTMSQYLAWQNEHSRRPGIRLILREGTHMDLVREQQARFDRFGRLMTTLREHDFSLTGVAKDEMDEVIYGKDLELLSA